MGHAALDDAAQQIKRSVDKLSQLADELNWQHPEGWQGEASNLAREERVRLVRRFDDISHESDPLKRALWAAADAVETPRREQDEVDDLARRYDMTITSNGDVVANTEWVFDPFDEEAMERGRVADQLRDEAARILAQANTIDEELAAALRRAAYPAYYPDAQGNLSRLNPPPGGDPKQVNDWWLGLSEEERNELIATRPEWVGSTDGIPAEARDTANRQVLASHQADIKAEIDELEQDLARYSGTDQEMALRDKINALEARLRGLNDIQNRLENPGLGSWTLTCSASTGTMVRPIIAMGNPDTATNVATFVPGTGSGLNDIGREMGRADSMAEAAKTAGSSSTSVITWVGYAAPQDIKDAVSSTYAENAKQDLDRFQDGLRATHEGLPSHNTVIGHSYGSTVIGHAAATEGLDVDDVVFVGSPGVGVDNVADLNMPAGHVHATVAEHDIIHMSNVDKPEIGVIDVHGPDPAGSEFGANVFTSNPGTPGPWYQGGYSGEAHSQYWEDNNKALENMGLIIAGKPTT